MRAVLDYPHDLRELVETSVFDFYKKQVHGTIGFFGSPEEVQKAVEQCVPELTESSQVWKLIRGAEIWISEFYKAEDDGVVEFKMTFTCSWDDEHGLGLKFRDWKIVDFGGATD